MNLTEIDDGVFVCGQITEDFVGELAKAGFKTIICNRPASMREALKASEYPLLAYCKSGHRAETLYHLAKS